MSDISGSHPSGPNHNGLGRCSRHRSLGETVWRLAAYAGIVVGLVSAFSAFAVAPSLGAAFALSLASWMVLLAVRREQEFLLRISDAWRAVEAGIAGLAILGALAVLHWVGAAVVAILLLTAPPVWRRWAGGVRARRPQGTPLSRHEPAEPAAAGLRETVPAEDNPTVTADGEAVADDHFDASALDDDALCLAWRTSFVHLQAATTPLARALLVQRRQLVLDELTHRHEAGVARWLTSGARAASNPRRFLDL
jgi:hypothetical protein